LQPRTITLLSYEDGLHHIAHTLTVQHAATYYYMLQHTVTHCNIIAHTATNYQTRCFLYQEAPASMQHHTAHFMALPHTLQHTATHCNTLHHSDTLPGTATHYHTLLSLCGSPCINAALHSLLYDTTTHCNTLQHTVTQCNTLPHSPKPLHQCSIT